MAKLKGVEIGVLVSSSIRDGESGRQFLQLLLDVAAPYAPARFGDQEPINEPFDPTKLSDALKRWGDTFFWRSSKASITGGAYLGFRNTHDNIHLSMPASAFDTGTVVRFFEAIAAAFGVDLAFVHVRSDVDTTDLDHYKEHLMPWQTLTTHALRDGLPEFPWAMLFGPPYVNLFGRERLMGTPAARVEVIGDGVYVQLTSDPTDVGKRRDEYLAAQQAAKNHLGPDAFRGMSARSERRVPPFVFVTH